MRITKQLALEVKMLFEAHCLRNLNKEILRNYFNELRLEMGEDGKYYILIILKNVLPNYVTIPTEYRSLQVRTRIV